MIEKSNFRIEKCIDCYRITRIDAGDDLHTHIKSLRLCNLVIDAVCNEKIPLHFSKRCLKSVQRLSINPEYIAKIDKFLSCKKSKGKKQKYINRQINRKE